VSLGKNYEASSLNNEANMQRTKNERRHRAFLYQGNHLIVCKAFGWEIAVALKSPNRFLRQFRESNRRRVA
jgi:hypothetical protein